MTKKERIRALIAGELPDKQPFNFNIASKMKDRIGSYYGIESEEVENYIGNHLLYISYDPPENFITQKIGDNMEKDEFGITWNLKDTYDIGEWGMVDHPVKDLNMEGYIFPNPIEKGRFKSAEKKVLECPGRFNLLRITGLFDVAWRITGIEDMLMAMAVDPEFTDNILDKALEFNLGIIEQIPDYIEGVRFLEDWGQQKGLMMGPKYWRRFLKPRLKEMYQACKKKGLAVFAHSCGDITELFPELIELGVDVVDPIQPETMDLRKIKKEYGKDLVLFGGLGCQSTIPLGTKEDVIKEVEERLEFLADGGKYILGPSGTIPQEAPIENVVALIEYCKKFI